MNHFLQIYMTKPSINNEYNPSSQSNPPSDSAVTSMKSIEPICQPTDFLQQCENSLSKSATNTTDPKKLLQAAFQVTIESLGPILQQSKVLQDAAKDTRTKSGLSACATLMDYTTDELNGSIAHFDDLDVTKINKIVGDLKVWLSAVVTYQETCLDAFENTTGNAAEEMRKALNASCQLSSNTLAIVDNISAVLKSFDLPFLRRRLL